MKPITCLCLLLLSLSISSTPPSDTAEISFIDNSNKNHFLELPYLVDKSKIQYGVKSGLTVYKITLDNCNVKTTEDMNQYYAAYIEMPQDCEPTTVIKDMITHGADFIFISYKDSSELNAVLSSTYSLPVFLLDDKHEDIFNFNDSGKVSRHITILFSMVS